MARRAARGPVRTLPRPSKRVTSWRTRSGSTSERPTPRPRRRATVVSRSSSWASGPRPSRRSFSCGPTARSSPAKRPSAAPSPSRRAPDASSSAASAIRRRSSSAERRTAPRRSSPTCSGPSSCGSANSWADRRRRSPCATPRATAPTRSTSSARRFGRRMSGTVSLMTEPEAAAVDYARQERVPVGRGHRRLRLRRRDVRRDGPSQDRDRIRAARPARGDGAAGRHRLRRGALHARDGHASARPAQSSTPNDPATLAAIARLREECRRDKEALSSDTDATIQISLPGLHTEMRLTRAEFEEMIRPRIRETIDALGRAVRSAGLGFDDIDRVLLVGGTSRIPLVAEMVRESTGRPVAVDAHPKHTMALGAAYVAEQSRLAAAAVEAPATIAEAPAAGRCRRTARRRAPGGSCTATCCGPAAGRRTPCRRRRAIAGARRRRSAAASRSRARGPGGPAAAAGTNPGSPGSASGCPATGTGRSALRPTCAVVRAPPAALPVRACS